MTNNVRPFPGEEICLWRKEIDNPPRWLNRLARWSDRLHGKRRSAANLLLMPLKGGWRLLSWCRQLVFPLPAWVRATATFLGDLAAALLLLGILWLSLMIPE